MSEAIPSLKWPVWPVAPLVFGALPPALVLWDWLSGADLVARLWTMPGPVAAFLAGAVLLIVASGLPLRAGLEGIGATGRLIVGAALALFLYAVLATSLFAANPVFGLLKLGELALVAALALGLAALFSARPGERRGALRAFVAGTALALALLAVLRASGALDHLAPLMLPGFIHIRIMGFPVALALAAGLGLWPGAGARERAALFVCLAVLWTALFWSGGRGALLAVVLGGGFAAALLPALRGAILPLLAPAALGFALALVLGPETPGFGMAARLDDAAGATSADALSSGRLEMWRAVLTAALDRPLLGHGYAQARWAFLDAGFETAHLHAHNLPLDAALALGLPLAALAAVAALAAAILGTVRARQAGDPASAAGAAMVWVFLVHALVDGIHFYAQGLLPLALGAALLLSARR